jgi:hypothetical protein
MRLSNQSKYPSAKEHRRIRLAATVFPANRGNYLFCSDRRCGIAAQDGLIAHVARTGHRASGAGARRRVRSVRPGPAAIGGFPRPSTYAPDFCRAFASMDDLQRWA